MPLTHVKGDLFAADPSSVLAHCISADAALGKGIAALFRDKFGQVSEIKRQIKTSPIGSVAVIQSQGRFIYNLVTKERYYNKPTYDTLKNSLEEMRKHAVANGVQVISMPRIGCGLDKLEWAQVERILLDIFDGEEILLVVYTV